MPYVGEISRRRLIAIEQVPSPDNPGELNYLITRLIARYMKRHEHNYTMMNDVVGALESAKHEFQRRIVDPYEDIKREQNGDVT